MSRRSNTDVRCDRCRMHDSLCVCSLIPRLETRTRLVLIIHRSEERKPTNSGQLAARCLPNSEVHVRGVAGAAEPLFSADPARQPLLLFPHEDAVPITEFVGAPRPVTLVVPDGTWRQASKVPRRMPGLADVPWVTLPHDAPSIYRLRSEHHDGRMATLEAIARALGILEGAHVREALERLFRVMVERTLWLRGQLRSEDVSSAIPERALAERANKRPIRAR